MTAETFRFSWTVKFDEQQFIDLFRSMARQPRFAKRTLVGLALLFSPIHNADRHLDFDPNGIWRIHDPFFSRGLQPTFTERFRVQGTKPPILSMSRAWRSKAVAAKSLCDGGG